MEKGLESRGLCNSAIWALFVLWQEICALFLICIMLLLA